MGMCLYLKARVMRYHCVGVTDNCELPDVGSGNQTLILFKSNALNPRAAFTAPGEAVFKYLL